MKQPRYILVVQRDPAHREETRHLLEQAGHHVTTTPDGPAALSLGAKAARPYDAVVVDLALDGMSGLDVAHRLRATPGGAGTPLVCVAPSDVVGRRRDAFAQWFDACLGEPLSRAGLLEALAGVWARSDARRHAV